MKKRALFLVGLVYVCLYFSGVSVAQTTVLAPAAASGKITGSVLDSLTGMPVEYVTVALLLKGTTTSVGGTLTDGKGQFTFMGLKYGEYSLAFSFIGFRNKRVENVLVTEQAPIVSLTAVRLPQATTDLKEVTVTSLRPTITQEADKMVVSVEGTALAAGRTAFDVLSRAPGVFVDQDGNIQLNGRGGVTIMLDGKLTYLSASDIKNLLQSMAAENIKNIEIITNPSAKFDAEGASGVLNINLKKNDLRGINGSVFGTTTYNFKQVAGSVGGSLNHRAGKWNSFLTTEWQKRAYNRDGTFTRIFYTEEETIYFNQEANGKSKNLGPPTVRVGTDYSFNDKHSFGVMANYNQNTRWEDFNTATYIGNEANQPFQFIRANNLTTNTWANFTTNVHYVAKLDTLGTSLSADIDFVKISNSGFSNFYNYFTNLTTEAPATQDFLYGDSDNGFSIYSAKVDFAKTYANLGKVEVGAKASRVVSDNDSRFFFNNENGLVLDLNRTNHFLYDENIFAAYVNWNRKLGERYTVQAGLRAEETQTRGESLTTRQVTNRDYLNFFPSVFVQQKVSDNYQISYSYSRRIQRPNYGNLNPFIIYRDPYTYWMGNPGLRPQYTNAIGITQTFKKDYSLVFNYQHLQDVMSELPLLDVENATTIYTVGNVDDSQNFSLAAIAPVKIMKNWDTNNTFTVSYNEFRMMVNGNQEVNAQVLYVMQSTHNILLPLDIKMEVNGVVRGPGVSGLYKIAPMWWVHLGFRKSFLDKKLDLSVNVNDLFRTYRIKFDARIGRNINDFDQYFFSQNVGVTLRYNFSRGQKFDPQRRNTNLDELNRT